MITRRSLSLAILCLMCACASGGTDMPRRSRNLDVLTPAELESQPGSTLYFAIQRLRPNWLKIRGMTSINAGDDAIIVYRDDVRLGTLGVLHDITVSTVATVRFITGPEAASRFGPGHQSGAILVTTRRP
jgi:hypothetical protein